MEWDGDGSAWLGGMGSGVVVAPWSAPGGAEQARAGQEGGRPVVNGGEADARAGGRP